MSVTSSGFEDAIKIKTLPAVLRRGIADDAKAITAPAIEQAQIYGEELPDQVYERTGNLGEGWENSQVEINETTTGITLSHTNPVEYVMFVQGVGTQAELFEDRWPDLQAVANAAEPATVSRGTGSIAAELGRF